ncbi:MAG: hypothetical protein J3Q66DRAFT_351408 [Benniella sp.]|nr:MAG: hypothetical protein J3Q66DRAFT_351408 [Benniella sp.]
MDGLVKLWDMGTGECRYTFTGHTRFATGLVFSPKRNQLATGSEDMTARLWGCCIRALSSRDSGL